MAEPIWGGFYGRGSDRRYTRAQGVLPRSGALSPLTDEAMFGAAAGPIVYNVAAADSAAAADSSTSALIAGASATDGAAALDSAGSALATTSSAADNVTAADAASITTTFGVEAADAALSADASSTLAVFNVGASDAASASSVAEAFVPGVVYNVGAADSVAVTDAATSVAVPQGVSAAGQRRLWLTELYTKSIEAADARRAAAESERLAARAAEQTEARRAAQPRVSTRRVPRRPAPTTAEHPLRLLAPRPQVLPPVASIPPLPEPLVLPSLRFKKLSRRKAEDEAAIIFFVNNLG